MAVKGFRGAGHTPSLVAALVHFDVSFLCWVLIGALSTTIAKDLGLNAAQKGLMVAVPPLGGALFRLLLGSCADRFGIKRLGLGTMALTLLPLAWGFLGGDRYWEILCIGLLLGIAGASFAVALPLVSRWYPPEHQGLALGIAGAGNSGTLVAALAAPRLAAHVGFHGTFGFAMIPVALAWVVFLVLAKEPPPVRGPRPSGSILGLLRERDPRWLCAFYLVSFGGFVGLSGYLPIFFVDGFALSRITAGSLTALCASAGSLLRPLGGALADRVGGTRVLAAVLLAVAGLTAVLAMLPALATTVLLLFLVLGALGMGNGAVFQLVGRRVPGRVGAMTGLVGAAGGLGGFLLPFGFGAVVSRTGSFAGGFVTLGAVAAAMGIAALRKDRAWTTAPRPAAPAAA